MVTVNAVLIIAATAWLTFLLCRVGIQLDEIQQRQVEQIGWEEADTTIAGCIDEEG